MDSGLIESETHPAPVVLNYNLRVYVHKAGNFAWITIHYGVCYQKHPGALGKRLLCQSNVINFQAVSVKIFSNNR